MEGEKCGVIVGNASNFQETGAYGGMVCDGMGWYSIVGSYEACGNGKWDFSSSEVYLQHFWTPMWYRLPHNFFLIQDNARPQTAQMVKKYLQTIKVSTIDGLACLPDMIYIEHVLVRSWETRLWTSSTFWERQAAEIGLGRKMG